MYDISHITNYILFLKQEQHLQVSLHSVHPNPLIATTALSYFNIHENAYCSYIKRNPDARKHCISQQCKAFRRCSEGEYMGSCYAGVTELVYPVSDGSNLVAFISVSGYRCPDPVPFLKSVSLKFSFDIEKLTQIYRTLKETPINKAQIDTLIFPLCDMLQLAFQEQKHLCSQPLSLSQQVQQYIQQYHTQPLSVESLCERFCCSRSYLSTQFKQCCGVGIREYITLLRMQDAKQLLCNTSLTVTEIAYSVGFCDSNYFSTQFKRTFGISPLTYRKQQKKPSSY